jgi:hypothetical protein
VVSANYVNPLYLIWLDQIHRHDGSLVAFPSKPDLIQARALYEVGEPVQYGPAFSFV